MALVGDIIMGCREQMTDLPSALASPAVASVSETAATTGPVTFTTGQVFRYQVTQLNPWGESAGTAIASYTVLGGFVYLVVAGTCSFTATAIRVYFSAINGAALDQYIQLTVSQQGTFVVIVGGTQSGFSTAPLRSSAWNPDTDGTAASAFSMYRWLNEGLNTASVIADGIKDITGIPSTVGTAQYPLIGIWKRIDSDFYDGYPVEQGTKQQIFRHSPVTGLSGTCTMNVSSNHQFVEFWPQPERTAGNGVLSLFGLPINSTTLDFTPGSSGFVLGFGLALVGTYPPTALLGASSCELVYYSGTASGQLLALNRGMGGTVEQAWPVGTPVQEVNIYMTGLRKPINYTPGQALTVLSLPPEWVDAIRVYLLYRFRDAEQNRQEAKSLLDEFTAKCKAMTATRQVMGPRRIQVGGSGVEVASGFGSIFGGVILP